MDLYREGDIDMLIVDREEEDHRNEADEAGDAAPSFIGLQDPPACIDACFKQFVEKWYKKTQGSFGDVCGELSRVQPNMDLWQLYCCDSTDCGVWAKEKGQSPSVDLIINECQNAGNYLIVDPGPPPDDSSCVAASASAPGETGFLTIVGATSMATSTISSTSSPATHTSSSSELNSTTSGIGVAMDTSTGLTEGSKAAIGMCSSLATIAIIFLVGFLLCRRRTRPKTYMETAPNAPRLGRSSSEPPSGSRTPLITPPPSASSKGPPLTPPARLSDRRFLPSLLKQGGTPSSSVASGIGERGLLPSPLGTPTEKKSALRYEQQANTSTSPTSPSTPAAVHFAPNFLRDSGSSYSSGPGGASTITTTASNKIGSVTDTPLLLLPLSPTRPARPHDSPLEIPNLVAPAGPPPSRALPAPPPYHPTSPTFTVSPVSPSTSPFALPLTSEKSHIPNGANAGEIDEKANPGSVPPGIALSASNQELRELTESYARETSESWGSWGAAGGGPGVSIVGGKKGGRGSGGRSKDRKGGSASTVSLQELDLEKLGGKY
ncbi:hypothetical protein M426DRAFT_262532 [Hypoxylon sp. CI-4A]|nr:hypothetical protein M426DRAFT_262532 [Hypoxylon sp. CI-4A]